MSYLQAWIGPHIDWLSAAKLWSAAHWVVRGLGHTKRCPPQRIWSGDQFRAVRDRLPAHVQCIIILFFSFIYVVSVASLCLCLTPRFQHRAPHSCGCGTLLRGGVWLYDPSGGYCQHPKFWVQPASSRTGGFPAPWPQVWVDQSRVQVLVRLFRRSISMVLNTTLLGEIP